MKEKEIKIKGLAHRSYEELLGVIDVLYPEVESIKQNNNGWIKIESEEDLPKDYDTQHFDLYTHSTNNIITHYQLKPIEKPKPPIY